MSTREHVHSVVESLEPVVENIGEEQMGAPTPCTEYDVRTLANHLLGTSEAMRRIGADEAMDPDDPWGTGSDHMGERWREDLTARMRGFATAWQRPEAWEGDAMGGAMPRSLAGDMGFVELVLHGWDLARGTGQDVRYEPGAVARALEIMDQIGEQGRAQGAFAAEVELPDDADDFARVLAKAGRDPQWSAGTAAS